MILTFYSHIMRKNEMLCGNCECLCFLLYDGLLFEVDWNRVCVC